jgi:hypothetical protein
MMIKMNNIQKAAFYSLIAVMTITMITSNQLSMYASPTTEDDGWTEGDYEGSPEEQEEQAQEDWEDAGRPGDNGNDDDNENDDNNENQDEETQICPDGSVLPVDQECPQPELQICPDGSAVQADETCPLLAKNPSLITCFDGSSVATLAECPPIPESEIPDPAFAPGFYAESVPETPEPLPICDGSFQDCITQNGNFCGAGSGAHECECNDDMSDCPNQSLQEQKECYDGIIVVGDQPCPPPKDPSPYCNTPAAEDSKSCWDVKDYSQDTGLYSCNDGTHKDDWKDCVDVSTEYKDFCKKNPLMKECYPNLNNRERNNGEKTKVVHETTVIQSATATATANTNAADVSNCKLDGSADGILQKFDSVKYQACGLFTNAQKAYSDGFVMGCTQVGNTQLICQALADTSELNMKTQLTQTQTAIQPTQAIEPATIGG